jgi:hypothetical protein
MIRDHFLTATFHFPKPADFLDKIIHHYLRESHQGLGAAIFGGLLLIGALLLFQFARPQSFLRGLALPFLFIGLVMGIGGSLDNYQARKSLSEKTALFQQDQKTFFTQEIQQVKKTHRSWRRIFIIWSVLAVAGIAMLFGFRKSYWTGVAIGTILVSMAGHVEEAISRNFNEKYYHEVTGAALYSIKN